MKRLGTIALTAALLSFGGTYGLQAQEHHGHRDDHQEHQLSKKEQKEIQKQIRQNEQRDRQRTKQEQKALNARIREQEAARVRAEQIRAQRLYQAQVARDRAYQAQVARDRELRTRVLAPATYRYLVSGNNRVTNRSGAELLQRAVRDGYAQGYSAGRNDLSARQRFNYYDDQLYRAGTYGYSSGYIPASDYQYYYREGFERGYQDGYYQNNQFGSVGSTGRASILAAALATILGFTLR